MKGRKGQGYNVLKGKRNLGGKKSSKKDKN